MVKKITDIVEPIDRVSEAASKGRLSDLVVHERDRVTLSYNVERFKPNYKILTPKNIDEVKQAIGIPKEAQFSRSPHRLTSLAPLSTYIPSIADLKNPKLARQIERNAMLAAREYVQGDYNMVTNMTGLINEWLASRGPKIVIVTFPDIIVNNGGVLHVSKDTNALSANSIKLYGTGRIEAEGDLTIDCTSLEGEL